MTSINHHLRPVQELLQQKYAVPYYQRDYKWSKKQFEELLNDLQEEFSSNYKPEHGRIDVAKYSNYFLGTVLTTNENESPRKIIIDGQQRITSLCILYIYLLRQNQQKNLSIGGYITLVKSESYGTNDFNIEVEASRNQLFNALVDFTKTDDELIGLESMENCDDGTKNLYERYQDINDLLDDEIKAKLEFFADWIAHKVILFEIVLPTEHDAHKVFLTMNDRGLNLSPIEMLKGELLSKITDSTRHNTAHITWVDYTRRLQDIDRDEDSNFIKTWLRAKYAADMRNKSEVGKKDYEEIGDFYHRWVHDNKNKLALITHDDFYNFIELQFKKYSNIYLRIIQYSKNLTAEYPEVFFNADKDITFQPLLILASICDSDSDLVINQKIKIVSKYLDIYTTTRIVNDKKNTYDNLKEPLFSLVLLIRNKSVNDLIETLKREYARQGLMIENIINLEYGKASTSSILHILARIAAYLENQISQTTAVGFETYIDRRRNSRTFDIEHILADSYEIYETSLDSAAVNDFENRDEFKRMRNNIGNLILLPRSRNRSLQDANYTAKVKVYATENITSQTLCQNFYQNNPALATFIVTSGISITPYVNFVKSSLVERQNLYKIIAQKIYDIDQL